MIGRCVSVVVLVAAHVCMFLITKTCFENPFALPYLMGAEQDIHETK